MEQRDHQVGQEDEKDVDAGQYEGGAEAEKGKSVAGAEEKKELTPDYKADVAARTKNGNTPVLLAAGSGCTDVVKISNLGGMVVHFSEVGQGLSR